MDVDGFHYFFEINISIFLHLKKYVFYLIERVNRFVKALWIKSKKRTVIDYLRFYKSNWVTIDSLCANLMLQSYLTFIMKGITVIISRKGTYFHVVYTNLFTLYRIIQQL